MQCCVCGEMFVGEDIITYGCSVCQKYNWKSRDWEKSPRIPPQSLEDARGSTQVKE